MVGRYIRFSPNLSALVIFIYRKNNLARDAIDGRDESPTVRYRVEAG